MKPLPMLPSSCSLTEKELIEQLERYRLAGDGGTLIERTPRRIVIEVGPHATDELIDRLMAVESRCCPFFDLDWDANARRLRLGVASGQDEAALSQLGEALTSGRGRARE